MAITVPPPPTKSEPGSFAWMDWYKTLWSFLNTAGTIAWSQIDKAGSSLADLATRLHSDLQGVLGTGQYHISSAEATSVTNLNNGLATSLRVNGSGSLGYASGSGGAVVQATNKGTTVVLNKPTGRITMNSAALAAGAAAQFTFTNSYINDEDVIIINIASGSVGNPINYTIGAGITTGGATLYLRNVSGGSLSEAVVLNFAVIKVATA